MVYNSIRAGVNSSPMSVWGSPQPSWCGTTLLAVAGAGDPNGTPFITLGYSNSGVVGMNIFYPNQRSVAPPIAYPWTIRCGSAGSASTDDIIIQDILLVNSYDGLDLGLTYKCQRHFVSKVRGGTSITTKPNSLHRCTVSHCSTG